MDTHMMTGESLRNRRVFRKDRCRECVHIAGWQSMKRFHAPVIPTVPGVSVMRLAALPWESTRQSVLCAVQSSQHLIIPMVPCIVVWGRMMR